MPIDPTFLPPAAAPEEPAARPESLPVAAVNAALPTAATPQIGHTLLFAVFVLLAAIIVVLVFGFSIKHLAARLHETAAQMAYDPRISIPLEAIWYAIAATVSVLAFPQVWRRSFAEGVHWRAAVVRRHWLALVVTGVITSILVQILSNFLPIPNDLPIEKFFTQRLGVWIIVIFGTTVAPAAEELAFRGFLLPSLAGAWDWVIRRSKERGAFSSQSHQLSEGEPQRRGTVYSSLPPEEPTVLNRVASQAGPSSSMFNTGSSDPPWSIPAIIFSTIITSIGFTAMHGAQLAHSFAPLAVLFAVSVVLCVTRLRFHSLAASTVVHSMYNATIFVMLFIGTDGFRHLDKLGK
jgi:membrane protease YdiL (CAAX protease family)